VNWHLDWTAVISGLALLLIGWAMRKLIALCKLAIQEIRMLATIEDVKRSIEESNAAQLEKIRKEGLLNGIYVRDDEGHKLLVENVQKLIRAKTRNGSRRLKLREPV